MSRRPDHEVAVVGAGFSGIGAAIKLRSMLSRRKNQVFFTGSCGPANSYYFDRHGDAPFRASPTVEAAWRSAHFDLGDYRFA